VLPTYNLRQDGYSRAIAGESSGGICAFNAAWFMPDKFARVHSAVGSFTSIQWRSKENVDGGNVYPFMVRKDPKRNIRVWMSDGSDDLENNHGSWPMQAIAMVGVPRAPAISGLRVWFIIHQLQSLAGRLGRWRYDLIMSPCCSELQLSSLWRSP
jgi:S-formylglutathione hydrolase FrmB